MKKKAKVKSDDPILVFHNFDSPDTPNLKLALVHEEKMIKAAVKKPMENLAASEGLFILGEDSGLIEEDAYVIRICKNGPVFDSKAMEKSFGGKADVLRKYVLTLPFGEVKAEKNVKIRLDGEEYTIEKGEHFFVYEF